MGFHSILFEKTGEGITSEGLEAPAFFADLNLDQAIDAITASKQEYNLKPFFYTPLHDADAIQYRYEVMRDLEDKLLLDNIRSFAEKMREARRYLASVDKLYYKRHKQGWFLAALEIYCGAVNRLALDLTAAALKSRGLSVFREYVADYVRSAGFTSLVAETENLKAALSSVKYTLILKDAAIIVRSYEAGGDYSAAVEETFAKFKQGAAKDYRIKFSDRSGMNHIEAQILDSVAKLYPEIFQTLDAYCTKYADFFDGTIGAFDREIQFYIAYLEHMAKLEQAGLRFCYPQVSTTGKDVYNYEGFDLALADKLTAENALVVCNDFSLSGQERVIVVSGPNQGGKTTFARTFGQLHYLASLGCPVPGREARLFLYDRLFTHFEKEEDIKNLRGKLQDDLVRIHDILNQATAGSIVIMNEIFTSTTLDDAIFLGKKVMERIIGLDLLCVCVTFIDELAAVGRETVSMVSTVVPESPATRTFKIVRRSADGLAYAISIAEKYRLTYGCIKERIKA